MKTSAREIAFLALSVWDQNLIDHTLEKWKKKESPSSLDFALAKEIAAGTIKRLLSLENILKKVMGKRKLRIRPREKMLLFSAIYQHIFMNKIPMYAIISETLNLAKKYFNKDSAAFIHAILNKLDEKEISFSQRNNAFDLGVEYSYPPYFIKRLIEDYGFKKTKQILDVQNHFFPIMSRIRKNASKNFSKTSHSIILEKPFKMIQIKKEKTLDHIIKSEDFYIQNVTPVLLFSKLASPSFEPKSILDLCSSPGGKLLLAHDFFPKAKLYANDVSEKKLQKLKENIRKYDLSVTLSCQKGENFTSEEHFDLIIIDAPCSNSGVLHKRAEARWRITPENLEELCTLQYHLIKRALSLLSSNGQIWYMTCSILYY